MPIYTRTGDNGTTDLANGHRTAKTAPRMQAVGTLDELNAHLGLALAHLAALAESLPHAQAAMQPERGLLTEAQRQLFAIGAWAAAAPSALHLPTAAHTQALECHIDLLQHQQAARFEGFILPGGCLAAAQLHVARTVCRRAERDLLAAGAADWENAPQALAYINRLSDFLYAAARKTNILADVAEIKW